ncbi:MAG: glycosyltransferase, partial [Rhizonema sp. PD38]|nr:glycosyltransferase [Rhizonema sp. PD38]
PTGGAEMMLYKLLSKINQEQFEAVVVSLMDRGTLGDRIEALGIPVHTIGMKSGKPTPASIWRLIHLIRQLKPDLIQGWMYHGNLAALLASVFCGYKIPVFWSIHYSIDSLASDKKLTVAIIRLCAYLSKFVTKIIFVSHKSKSQHEALGYNRKNNCVIPNGFDNSLFVPSIEDRVSVRAELNLPEKSFLIGLICRYHPMKDHANFIQAAAILLKSHPDIYFLLIGKGVDQNNQILQKLIQELEIFNRVYLLGERSDIPRLTAALDIASSASAYGEAFPLVLGEAMSCGVPCVVTDVGDSSWILGDTGWVVPPRNPEALSNAWKKFILLSSEDRKALREAARTRIIEQFSLLSIVANYEDLYMLVKKNAKI